MLVSMRRFAILVPILILSACGGPKAGAPTASSQTAPKPDSWNLVCLNPNDPTPALLWNGEIGVRIGRNGSGYDAHGTVLPMFLIDEYEKSGEEKIKPLPSPLQTRWTLDGKPADDVSKAINYRQTLDMKTGVLETSWENVDATFSVITVMHPTLRQIGQKWMVFPKRAIDAVFQSYSGPVGNGLSHSAPKPGTVFHKSVFLSTPNADGTWKDLADGKQWSARISGPITMERTYVCGLGSLFDEADLKPEGKPFLAQTFEQIFAASKSTWAKRWSTDIEIDGPIEDQQAVHSFLFYLRSSISSTGPMSLSPYGLSSETYNGHIFWDADIWVFPALSLIYPDAAKTISKYRLAHLDSAKQNHDERRSWYGQKATPVVAPGAAQYPWESSTSGLEVAPGESKQEHHISGSVLFSLNQARQLGLISTQEYSKVAEPITKFYMARSVDVEGQRQIKWTMSPDEFHTGDNDLYTNCLLEWILNSRQNPPPVYLPRDGQTLLTYDGDLGKGYKQAAALLAIYPLQNRTVEEKAKEMMVRYAGKCTKNGPAMTDSLEALIWARINEPDKAYVDWKRSWEDFTKAPLMLFSEKRSKPSTYFTTGASGCLQTVIFGFLGFRINEGKVGGALWSTKLQSGTLTAWPHLPEAWKRVTFRNFTVLGKRYTLTATHEGAKLQEGDR